MITINCVVLAHQRKKDDTYPVNIRVTYKKQSSYIRTPYFVVQQQLDSRFNIIDNEAALLVQDDILKIRKEIARNFCNIAGYNAAQLKEHFFYCLYMSNTENSNKVNYPDFVRKFIEKIKKRGTGTFRNYELSLNRLISFVGHEQFTFDDITLNFLQNFDKYLQDTGTGSRGRNLYFSNIRKIFNEAILEFNDDERGIEKIKRNPFTRFKIPEFEQAEKRARTIAEIKLIRDSKPELETLQLARDVYMLSFYLVGMNTIDMFNAETIKDGRLEYYRAKTRTRRKDKAFISIKIVPEAEAIIEKFKSRTGKRVFNFSTRYSNSDAFNSFINKYLKRLGTQLGIDDLDFYSARHTWATLYVNECGGTEAEAAFCLNHVSEHKVTAGYIKTDYTRIDRANSLILVLLK